MFSCDECFDMRIEHVYDCPECGKHTLHAQLVGYCSQAECSECGYGYAGGTFLSPCYEDEEKYDVTINKPDDKKIFVKLARILKISAIELHEIANDDIIRIAFSPYEWRSKLDEMQQLGVEYKLGEDFKKKYPRIITCPHGKG